jgi:hypothetical protein
MKRLYAAVLLFFVSLAFAAPSAKVYTAQDAQGNIVRLFDAKCEGPTWMAMKKAAFHYQGKDYDACWMAVGNTIILFDSAGDVTPLPKEVFKPETSV